MKENEQQYSDNNAMKENEPQYSACFNDSSEFSNESVEFLEETAEDYYK